jgi:hypothetical protein
MIVVERRPKPGTHSYSHCQAPGCTRSARFLMVFLGTEHTALCSHCKTEWSDAYDNALTNWADEFKDAA